MDGWMDECFALVFTRPAGTEKRGEKEGGRGGGWSGGGGRCGRHVTGSCVNVLIATRATFYFLQLTLITRGGLIFHLLYILIWLTKSKGMPNTQRLIEFRMLCF